MYYKILPLTVKTAVPPGFLWAGFNYFRQYKALANPQQIDQYGRLGAMLAAKDFKHDQVGYGVYPSIRLIHLLFGNFGQQHIGRIFNSPEAQAIMKKPRTTENHLELGKMEYDYWISQLGKGDTFPDELMIKFGAAVNPEWRAFIQEMNAKARAKITRQKAEN